MNLICEMKAKLFKVEKFSHYFIFVTNVIAESKTLDEEFVFFFFVSRYLGIYK